MPRASIVRAATGAAAVLTACSLAACSSSGGGVSESKLESKLKNDADVKMIESQGGTKALVVDQFVHCIAEALRKNADQQDLADYLAGKKSLSSVAPKAKGATDEAQTEAQTCAKNSLRSDASSISSSAGN